MFIRGERVRVFGEEKAEERERESSPLCSGQERVRFWGWVRDDGAAFFCVGSVNGEELVSPTMNIRVVKDSNMIMIVALYAVYMESNCEM